MAGIRAIVVKGRVNAITIGRPGLPGVGGEGAGAVESINGQTGAVVLDAAAVGADAAGAAAAAVEAHDTAAKHLPDPSAADGKILGNQEGAPTWITPPSSMVYPGAGIPQSTGSAWGTSLTLDTDPNLAADSDLAVPSQRAIKAAINAAIPNDYADPVATYNASGEWYHTTGSISIGNLSQLNVASTVGMKVGMSLAVARAGAAASILVTTVTNINVFAVTLATPAAGAITNMPVYLDRRTTGSITSGTNQLSVEDADGWTVGMGIAVAGAGAAGVELVTYIDAIDGLVFTLHDNAATTATNRAINHDDTRAINSAIAAGGNIYLRGGLYNVTTPLTYTRPITIRGDGPGQSIIMGRAATNHILNDANSNDYYDPQGGLIDGLGLEQSPLVTPTAGYALYVGGTGSGLRTRGMLYQNLGIRRSYGGIGVHDNTSQLTFRRIRILDTGNGAGLYYNSAVPNGDHLFDNIHIARISRDAAKPGINVVAADTLVFNCCKLNWCDLLVNGSAGSINNIRFQNMSVESAGASFGTSGGNEIRGLQVIGGGYGLATDVVQLGVGSKVLDAVLDGVLLYPQTAAYHAITVNGAKRVVVSNNVIEHPNTTVPKGITFINSATGLVVGNSVNCSGEGITTDATISADLSVIGNNFYSSTVSINAASKVLPWVGNTGTNAYNNAPGPGSTQGQILYWNGTAWTLLAPGTAGQLLRTGGAGANPSWVTAEGTGSMNDVVDDTTPQLGGQLDLNSKTILMTRAPSVDHSGSGTVINDTVAETAAIGNVVYLNASSTWNLADKDTEAESSGMLALCMAGGSGSHAEDLLLQGFFRDDSWAWTPGGKLYLAGSGTPGVLTQTIPPDAGDFVRIVGWAKTATVVFFTGLNPVYVER